MDAEVIRKLVPTEFYTQFFKLGLRPDDREVMQTRKIALNFDASSNFSSSLIVRQGNTSVLIGFTPTGDNELTGNLSPQLSLYAKKIKGNTEGKLDIQVIVDDGGLIEVVNLGLQLLLFGEVKVFAFVFADLYR
mmetsp:Transcript_6367/g.11084  ORF Transcript_6367/g.11084 Transcript_6367/m.11084 type:complete len:134 (+) Transcript_6367:21-422(+)